MSILTDWVREAATDIYRSFMAFGCPTPDAIALVIKKHSPFKQDAAYVEVQPGVAYMPVPRCETCEYWLRQGLYDGQCLYPRTIDPRNTKMWAELYDGVCTTPDFGCVEWKGKR